MKATNIVLRDLQGQLAGGIVHIDESRVRLQALQSVAEDISTGVTPVSGMDEQNAEGLSMALIREVSAIEVIGEQIRLAYAYSIALASRLGGD
jgi:hypothetical protein